MNVYVRMLMCMGVVALLALVWLAFPWHDVSSRLFRWGNLTKDNHLEVPVEDRHPAPSPRSFFAQELETRQFAVALQNAQTFKDGTETGHPLRDGPHVVLPARHVWRGGKICKSTDQYQSALRPALTELRSAK